jgi:phage/plasmid-like protein (TIGR03299 family)
MSAAVETMMYAGAVPWHGLGVKVDSNLPWREAIAAAGLDWTVERKRMFVYGPGLVPESVNEVPDAFAMVRDSDGAVLGVVGSQYAEVQNAEAFETFGTFFGDAAVLNTAGSLHGGKVVWGLAECPEGFSVGNDTHRKFLLVTTTHDGSGKLRVYPTAVRVVCANTLAASKGDEDSGFAVRHVGDVQSRLTEKSSVLAASLGWFDVYQKQCSTLLERMLSTEEEREIISELVNAESTRGKNVIDRILYLARKGDGNAPYAGTAYALLQGVTDYVDHERLGKQTGEKHFATAVLGTGAKMKAEAMELILERTGGAATVTTAPAPTTMYSGTSPLDLDQSVAFAD